MDVLLHADLNLTRFQAKFDKVRAAIELGDFKSADVKKLAPTSYYRAKLDDTTREAYLALGPRQSIFEPGQREAIHALFDKYRQWLADSGLFDSNLVAHEWQALAQPQYDFIVVDEVQDLTNAQLALILRMLKAGKAGDGCMGTALRNMLELAQMRAWPEPPVAAVGQSWA